MMREGRDAMDRLVEDHFGHPSAGAASASGRAAGFPVDVVERDKAFVVRASLPGVAPEKVDVTIHEDRLTIRAEIGQARSSQSDHWLLRERFAGKVERTIRLPHAIDAEHTEAVAEFGVLTLTIPKLERRHQIKIGGAPSDGAAKRNPSEVDPTKLDPSTVAVPAQVGTNQKEQVPLVHAADTPAHDLVSADSESSFPASDPPSWTPERA